MAQMKENTKKNTKTSTKKTKTNTNTKKKMKTNREKEQEEEEEEEEHVFVLNFHCRVSSNHSSPLPQSFAILLPYTETVLSLIELQQLIQAQVGFTNKMLPVAFSISLLNPTTRHDDVVIPLSMVVQYPKIVRHLCRGTSVEMLFARASPSVPASALASATTVAVPVVQNVEYWRHLISKSKAAATTAKHDRSTHEGTFRPLSAPPSDKAFKMFAPRPTKRMESGKGTIASSAAPTEQIHRGRTPARSLNENGYDRSSSAPPSNQERK